jgi:hypothetical protein
VSKRASAKSYGFTFIHQNIHQCDTSEQNRKDWGIFSPQGELSCAHYPQLSATEDFKIEKSAICP